MNNFKSFYIIMAFAFLLIATKTINAQQPTKMFSLEISPEFRKENFRWSIAGNEQGTNPNILSELIFNPIRAKGFHIDAGYTPFPNSSFHIYYNRLFTYNGEATDFDYDGDNRTQPSSQLYLQSNKGFMRSTGFTAHEHFFSQNTISLIAGIGFDLTRELFYLTDINDSFLNTTYEANWNGPLLTAKGIWNINRFLSIGSSLTGRYLFYNAKANWNLVESFQHPVSFTHKAAGWGLDYDLGATAKLSNTVKLSIINRYSFWKTKKGLDKLYQSDGQILRAQMNGAIKKSIGLGIKAGFEF
ncbi:MAG: hypothetical protein ACK5NK_16030 [Niabella sp.]